MSQVLSLRPEGATLRRVVAGLFSVVILILLIIGAALIPSNPGPGLGVVVVALALLFLMFRYPTIGYLRVSPSGIDIKGPLGTRHVARGEISEIAVEEKTYTTRGGSTYQRKTPRIHLTSGKAIWLAAYRGPDSVESKLVSNPGADAYATQIRQALGMGS